MVHGLGFEFMVASVQFSDYVFTFVSCFHILLFVHATKPQVKFYLCSCPVVEFPRVSFARALMQVLFVVLSFLFSFRFFFH